MFTLDLRINAFFPFCFIDLNLVEPVIFLPSVWIVGDKPNWKITFFSLFQTWLCIPLKETSSNLERCLHLLKPQSGLTSRNSALCLWILKQCDDGQISGAAVRGCCQPPQLLSYVVIWMDPQDFPRSKGVKCGLLVLLSWTAVSCMCELQGRCTNAFAQVGMHTKGSALEATAVRKAAGNLCLSVSI